MKKVFLSVFIFCCFVKTNDCLAQDFSKPTDYMSYLQKQQENITKRYLSYTSASAHGKREKKVEALRSKLLDEIQESRMNISGMPAWQGDKAYRDTAVSFMKFYYNVMNDDYAKVINMEEIAERSYDEMEAFILLEEAIDQKLSESNERMSAAEKAFAAKNNITLVEGESKTGDMMKEVNGLNKHYHEVYLIFFKPNVQEKNMIEAIDKGNVTGIEQSRSAMLKYAQEGLEKLKSVKSYKGDNSLIRVCTNNLNFYVKEADKVNAVNDYFLAKEKFDAIKKETDKKNNRTKEDVDAYNKAVNDINKASGNYNSLMQELNNTRNENLKDWNQTMKTYFDEHTPHYK